MQMKTKMYKLSLGFGSVAYWSWGLRVSIFLFNLLKFSYSWIWMEKIPNNLFSVNETQITIKETVFFLFYCYMCFIWCKSIVEYHLIVTLFFIVTEYGNLTELYQKVESPRSQFAINPSPPWGVYAFWP